MSEREAKLEQALREMVKLFDMDNRRVHKIEDKWWAVVPAADAERAYSEAVRALADEGKGERRGHAMSGGRAF